MSVPISALHPCEPYEVEIQTISHFKPLGTAIWTHLQHLYPIWNSTCYENGIESTILRWTKSDLLSIINANFAFYSATNQDVSTPFDLAVRQLHSKNPYRDFSLTASQMPNNLHVMRIVWTLVDKSLRYNRNTGKINFFHKMLRNVWFNDCKVSSESQIWEDPETGYDDPSGMAAFETIEMAEGDEDLDKTMEDYLINLNVSTN